MNNAMLSEARQTANVANACLSTGPRTEEGKARSSQNARKHGLTAAQLIIAAEDREEFEDFHAQLQTDIRPEGALQQILFDQLVASAWNLRRIRRMEAELTASAQSYLDVLDNPELTAKARPARPPRNPRRAQLPSLAPRTQIFANRRRTRAHASPGIHAASPAARVENADCKTNPSPGHSRPSKRRRRRILVWS